MRVLVAAFGTRGDVQPAVVAARALEAAGHHCECFVPPNLAGWVRGLGLQVTPVGLDYAELSRVASEGRLVELLQTLPKLRREVGPQVDVMLAAAKRADLVLGCSVFAAGQLLADLHQVPYRFLALSPFILPSREHPAPFVKSQRLPRWLNALSWRLNEPLWNLSLGGALNRRRRALGLPPARAVWRALLSRAALLACEPSVFPLAPPLDPHEPRTVQQLGALFLDEPLPLSPEVTRFLEGGPPPVYVGFGSMSDPHPARTARALVEAARRSKVRLLLSRGWAGFQLDASHRGEDVLLVGPEPHHLLFPRCAAVVHHGGIGTTQAAMRAGVPQLVLPHLLDQFYTAHRLELAGLGLGLAGRHGVTAQRLSAALDRALGPAVRQKAREVAARLTLDAPQRLVEALTGGA